MRWCCPKLNDSNICCVTYKQLNPTLINSLCLLALNLSNNKNIRKICVVLSKINGHDCNKEILLPCPAISRLTQIAFEKYC